MCAQGGSAADSEKASKAHSIDIYTMSKKYAANKCYGT